MAAEKITAQEATDKSIGLYGKVITGRLNRKIRPEVKIITDSDMFGECIFCQMECYLVRSVDNLGEIKKILKRDFLICDNKTGKNKLTELIPARGTNEVLFFMEIAYIAFQISQKNLPFLKAFVELYVMSIINNEMYVNEKLDKVTGYLRKGWDDQIKNLYKNHFDTLNERLYLSNLCKSLKMDLNNFMMIKKNLPFYP